MRIEAKYFSQQIINNSIKLIEKYQLKTLDSLHLSASLNQKDKIEYFISCDKKLLSAALEENFKIINPMEYKI